MNAIDRIVTTELLVTLEDARKGYSAAADRLSDSDRPELGPVFERFSRERGRFVNDLGRRALQRGVEPDVDGSPAGTLHRGFMATGRVVFVQAESSASAGSTTTRS